MAGRGCFDCGNLVSAAKVNTIDYITIQSTGNATDFGDATVSVNLQHAGLADTTRGCMGGGFDNSSSVNVIDYVTIASTGNATDFGDLATSKYYHGSLSDATRGVWGGGDANTIEYITIQSTGNATDFGDRTISSSASIAALASSTRGCFGGGANNNVIDYITIQSAGNATDFGDFTGLTLGFRSGNSGAADSTRGVFAGTVTLGTYYNNIDYITIASTGNSADFGDLTATAANSHAGCADSTRGCYGGGATSSGSPTNIIDYITIQSAGNATDFGDLTEARDSIGAFADQPVSGRTTHNTRSNPLGINIGMGFRV